MKVSSFQPMNIYETQSRAVPLQQQRTPDAETASDALSLTASGTDPDDIVSQQEKQFFAKLYPNDSQAITTYSTYSRNGVTKEYSVGSLFDQKS